MDDRAEQVLTIINRLLASFPGTQSGSPDDALDGYLLGTKDIPAEYLARAAQRFLSGSVPGQHMVFPPSPAQFATEARGLWYGDLHAEEMERKRLSPPSVDDVSDEERARVKAGFDALVADLSSRVRTEDAEADRRRKAVMDRTNARFMPDLSDEAMAERLGFTVGDAEDHADAA